MRSAESAVGLFVLQRARERVEAGKSNPAGALSDAANDAFDVRLEDGYTLATRDLRDAILGKNAEIVANPREVITREMMRVERTEALAIYDRAIATAKARCY